MFKTINGWTKKEMLSLIKTDFKKRSVNADTVCAYFTALHCSAG